MSQRSYAVYLKGGAHFTLRATRYERSEDAITFYGADEQPLEETYIDPASVIAVIPSAPSREGSFPGVR